MKKLFQPIYTLSAERKKIDETTLPFNEEISCSSHAPEMEAEEEVSHKSNGNKK